MITINKLSSAIKIFSNVVEKRGIKDKVVYLTGGEPLVYPKFKELFCLCKSLGFIIRLQTNGIAINRLSEADLKLFDYDKLTIKISLDGPTDVVHEILREKGSFDKIISGYTKLKSVVPNIRIGAKTVLHTKNESCIEDMLMFLYDMGFTGWTYNVLRNVGNANTLSPELFGVDEFSITKRLVTFFNNNPKYIKMANGCGFLRVIIAKEFPLYNYGVHYINCDGNVYDTQGEDAHHIGNLYKDDNEKIFCVDNVKNFFVNSRINKKIFDYVSKNFNYSIKERVYG